MKFEEIDGNCDLCSLKGEFCNGGMACYGGAPVEPPCVAYQHKYDNDEDLYNYLSEGLKQYEDWQDKQIRERKLKEEKNKKIQQKRYEYRMRNYSELLQIRKLKKSIKKLKEWISFKQSMSSAINWTNSFFKSAGNNNVPNDVIIDFTVQNKQIEEWEKQIITIKGNIKQKEKEFKVRGKNENNNSISKAEICRL
jgi:hypothetical protein